LRAASSTGCFGVLDAVNPVAAGLEQQPQLNSLQQCFIAESEALDALPAQRALNARSACAWNIEGGLLEHHW
jgi:hypothetical protein